MCTPRTAASNARTGNRCQCKVRVRILNQSKQATISSPLVTTSAQQHSPPYLLPLLQALKQEPNELPEQCAIAETPATVSEFTGGPPLRARHSGSTKRKSYAPQQTSDVESEQQASPKKERSSVEPIVKPAWAKNKGRHYSFKGYLFRSCGANKRVRRFICAGRKRHDCRVRMYTDFNFNNAHLGVDKQHTHSPDGQDGMEGLGVAASTIRQDNNKRRKRKREPAVFDGYRFIHVGGARGGRFRLKCAHAKMENCPVRLLIDASRQNIKYIGTAQHTCSQLSQPTSLTPRAGDEAAAQKSEPLRPPSSNDDDDRLSAADSPTAEKPTRLPPLVVDGYQFCCKGRSSGSSTRIRFMCASSGCPVRLTTDADRDDIRYSLERAEHTCDQQQRRRSSPPSTETDNEQQLRADLDRFHQVQAEVVRAQKQYETVSEPSVSQPDDALVSDA